MSRTKPNANYHTCNRIDIVLCNGDINQVRAQSLWVSHEGRWIIISSAPDEHTTHRKTYMLNADNIDKIHFIYEDSYVTSNQ
jgi:hypothetical protein